MLIFSAPFFIRYLHAFCLVAGPAKSWEVVARFIIKAEDEEQVGFNFLLYSIQLLFMVFFLDFELICATDHYHAVSSKDSYWIY